MTRYFEIGGTIIELSMDDDTSLPSTLSMVPEAERPERGRNSAKDKTSSMSKTAADTFDKAARVRRARRAISLALGIAAADGPLPIGDTIAVVGLGVYAAWEINHAAGDPLKMSEGPYRWR